MSDKQIPYYFTITSPWSYLGHAPFLKLADELGYEVQFKPVDFGAVFAQSGGLPSAEAPLSAPPLSDVRATALAGLPASGPEPSPEAFPCRSNAWQ